MMKNKFWIFAISFIALFSFQSNVFAYTTQIYSLAQQKNIPALQHIKQQLGSIDYQNYQGQTALCLSIHNRDYPAFSILVRLGANRQHPCVQRIPQHQLIAFNQGYKATYQKQIPASQRKPHAGKKYYLKPSISPTMMTLGGIAGIGGIVALAASGSGGSSGSGSHNDFNISYDTDVDIPNRPNDDNTGDSNNNSPNDDNNNPNTPNDNTVTLSPSYFETAEYKRGNFLDQINASDAYAKAYIATKSADGSITVSDKHISPVKVAVLDVGVYNHNDLPQIKNGYNYAYGPCRTSSQTNCWMYKEDTISGIVYDSGYAFKDSNGTVSDIIWYATEDDFNAYAAQYPENYVWSDNKYLYTPVADEYYIDHGTHVAGIIAAKKNNSGMHGVAQNAELIPIRYDLMSSITNPIKTAVSAGAKIINASLGTASTSSANAAMSAADWKEYVGSDYEGYKYLADKKSTLLVIAAGNESQKEPSLESGAGRHVSGLEDVMLVVAATKSSDPTKLASYSNQCGSTASYCLVAPGGDDNNSTGIISTVGSANNTEGMGGTSMAAPVVSGAAAFLWGVYPNLSAANVADILLETATDLGDKKVYGQGLLNLGAAVNQPLGKTTLAASNNIHEDRVLVENTKLRLPTAFRSQLLKQLPQSISMLDKYDRSFAISTNSLIKPALRNTDAFKNKLHRFASFNEKKHIQTAPNMSFGFTTSSHQNSQLGVGEMDVSFNLNQHDVRFYYKEDTINMDRNPLEKTKTNPFTAMNNAYGVEDTFHLNKKLKLKTEFVTGENALYETDLDNDDKFDKQAYAFQSTFEYEPINGLNVGFSAGVLQENDALLGLNGSGAFEIQDATTYFMGISASLNPIENLYLTGSYFYGMTDEEKQTAFLSTSRLYSDGFTLDAHYKLNGTDYVGLSLASPLRVKKGNALFDMPTGRDYYSDTVYREIYKASLKPTAREYDWSVYYAKEINPAMHLKAQTGVRINPDHQSDLDPDYQMLFGFDWKFN